MKSLASRTDVRLDALVKMVASARARGSVLAPLVGLVQFAQSGALRGGLVQTVPKSVCVTTEATVIQRPDSASVLRVLLDPGATRSVRWAVTVRIVRVCVTVLTGHAATTLMEAVCVSRASEVLSAEIECVLMVPTACTVNARASAKINTLSVVTQ